MEFEERNISHSEAFNKELLELGTMATPTTIIDDEVFAGFDRKRLKELLGI